MRDQRLAPTHKALQSLLVEALAAASSGGATRSYGPQPHPLHAPRGRGPRGTQQCLTCDGGDHLHSSGAWVHGEKPHGTLDVSGDAAAAIAQSNEVPKNHRPQRVPRIGKYFRRHIKKPTRRLKPPKGKVIDGRHEQYTLSYTMQLGIQRSVEYAHSVVFSVCNSFVRLRTLALGTTRQL